MSAVYCDSAEDREVKYRKNSVEWKDVNEAASTKPEDNLGIAFFIANKFTPKGVETEDTEEFSDACIGLIRAHKGYDPNKGSKFSTYAYEVVRNEIIKGWKVRRRYNKEHPMNGNDFEVLEDENERRISLKDKNRLLERLFEGIKIDERSKDILLQRFFKGKTLQEVGDSYGLSRERIRQLEAVVLENIRNTHKELIASFEKAIF